MDKITLMFPDFKTKAFTMSFDDGHDSDIPLARLMLKYDLKGSFNLCSGQLYENEEDVPTGHAHVPLTVKKAIELYSHPNFEVVSHGYNHAAVGHIPPSDAMHDMLTDRRKLESMFGKLVRGHVYPYGSYSKDAIDVARLCGFEYARLATSNPSFLLPASNKWLEWQPTSHLIYGDIDALLDKFINEQNLYYHGWLFYAWAHSFEFLPEGEWEKLEEKFKKVAHRDDIWYATNIEIHDYVEAYRSLKYSADATFVYNPTQIDVFLRCDFGQVCVPAGETVYFAK